MLLPNFGGVSPPSVYCVCSRCMNIKLLPGRTNGSPIHKYYVRWRLVPKNAIMADTSDEVDPEPTLHEDSVDANPDSVPVFTPKVSLIPNLNYFSYNAKKLNKKTYSTGQDSIYLIFCSYFIILN